MVIPKKQFRHPASTGMAFLAHSLAVALAFCGLAVISLVPVGAIRALIWLGFTPLAELLHPLEMLVLIADIAVFAVIFISRLAVLAMETIAMARTEIRKRWKGRKS